MAITKTLTKRDVDAAKTYTATTTGFAALRDGAEAKFVRGQSYRGSEPMVRERAELFIEAGTPENEWPGQFAGAVAVSERLGIAEQAEQAKHAPKPIAQADRVRVKQSFRLKGATFGEGVIYDRGDSKVKAAIKQFPDAFEIPARALSPEEIA
jgi:hypothetical protein